MAVVGFGVYAEAKFDLGVQEGVSIPQAIHPVSADFHPDGTNAVVATFPAPFKGDLRIVMRQSTEGRPVRTSRGAPPNGTRLGSILQIQVFQEGQPVPTQITYDKAIWSGLSWGVAEVRSRHLKHSSPMTVRCVSLEERAVNLDVQLYVVEQP